MPIRAMYISDDITQWDDDRSAATAQDSLTDLPRLLARVAGVAHPYGITLLLSGSAAVKLGFPVSLPPRLVQDHPALDAARATGWRVDSVSPWMTFVRAQTDVHIGVIPWLTKRTFVFHDPQPAVMVDRLYRFHRAFTVPYHGATPGLASTALLRDHHNGRTPMWYPRNWDRIAPAIRGTEVAPDWDIEDHDHGLPYEHMYDARRQFLSAAGYVTLALGELERHHKVQASAAPLPGYYEVTTPAWALGSMLPHPIGNNAAYGQHRWITGPTLGLLFELADKHNVLDYPEIHDAWLAPAVQGRPKTAPTHTGRPLHRWARQIGYVLDTSEAVQDTLMVSVAKDMYKHGIGLLERPGGRIYRPDWAHAIIAQARANQFRKIWRTYQQSGRTPVRVEHDQVWYASAAKDPHLNWPLGFPHATEPGGYTAKATRAIQEQM